MLGDISYGHRLPFHELHMWHPVVALILTPMWTYHLHLILHGWHTLILCRRWVHCCPMTYWIHIQLFLLFLGSHSRMYWHKWDDLYMETMVVECLKVIWVERRKFQCTLQPLHHILMLIPHLLLSLHQLIWHLSHHDLHHCILWLLHLLLELMVTLPVCSFMV